MKRYFGEVKRVMMGVLVAVFVGVTSVSGVVWAEETNDSVGFTVSPLTEHIVLEPGESYSSTIRVSNPGSRTTNIDYEVGVQPFFVDENYDTVFENIEDRSLMANWITINSPTTGTLKPNETHEITFTINVPLNAPAGGQYADVRVLSVNGNEGGEGSSAIGEQIAIGHLIFAEIAGNTTRQGEIISVDVPSFLLSGNIKGTSSIKNTGNVHGIVTYRLQVFPLFSDEEVYTNVEKPDEKMILPDRTLYNEIAWENTPPVGIFNVKYTVEFEGKAAEVTKMVIICPIWLLLIIFFVIAAIIIWIIMRVRHRSAPKRKNAETAMDNK